MTCQSRAAQTLLSRPRGFLQCVSSGVRTQSIINRAARADMLKKGGGQTFVSCSAPVFQPHAGMPGSKQQALLDKKSAAARGAQFRTVSPKILGCARMEKCASVNRVLVLQKKVL